MSARAIREIIIAGGGIVAWSCAAALLRQCAGVKVTVVAGALSPDSVTDLVGSTLPSITAFNRDIGLTEADSVARAGSGFRLGSLFEGWASRDYAHVYGVYGQPFGTASFHHHWIRARHLGADIPFDAHAPAAGIGLAGRFVHPESDPASPLSGFEYGLIIDPPRYRAMMRALALHVGASERLAEVRDVILRGDDGFVDALLLSDGGSISGDLFIDCTGPAALVRSALDTLYEDWSRWLPCDRILFHEGPPPAEPLPLDRVTALDAGWRWTATSPTRTSYGLVYASALLDDEKAAQASGAVTPAARLRPGRRREAWLRNCLAMGEAAAELDPLEWTGLHLAHSAIDRLIAMMPDRDCAAVELREYNRQTANEADRVRDFLALHYRATPRPGPMWRAVAEAEPPVSLAHTLSLFTERGRLPFYEEETFSRDSWLAVLLGQGIIPRRTDPLIDSFPPEQSDAAMAAMREGIASMAATLPSQALYLQQFLKRAAR